MSSLLEIMDKKSCGKWYAYEQSLDCGSVLGQ